LEIATQKTGGKQVEFDKHLREILRDKRYWDRKRMNIRRVEKQLEQKLEKYSDEIDNIENSKKEILQKAKAESEKIISDLNKKIENTIRLIKESNADKEKTRLARKELDDFTEKAGNQLKEDRKSKQNKAKLPVKKVNKKGQDQLLEIKTIEKGAKVKMKGQDLPGEVLDTNKKSVMVAFGNMVTTTHIDKLEPIIENEFKKHIKNYGTQTSGMSDVFNKKMKFNPDIDLRGKRADEALQELNTFIDDALMVNASQLRILHGKGNGILKQVIRDYLRTQDFIKSIKDEHIERGGAGITVVKLSI